MTGDELERAIDFILKSQARAEARIERNEEQLSQLTEQVSQLGAGSQQRLDTVEGAHAVLVRVLSQQMETQDLINKSLRETDIRQARLSASLAESLRTSEELFRASDQSLRTAMAELATKQSLTEEALTRLAEQTAGTERRLEKLIMIVEEGRGGSQ